MPLRKFRNDRFFSTTMGQTSIYTTTKLCNFLRSIVIYWSFIMKKLALSAVILLTSLVGSNANAGQACMTVGGSFTGSCKNIIINGPGCAGRSSMNNYYGYEVIAVCKNWQGVYTQSLPILISTNYSNGGGINKVQTQTCHELGNDNGQLVCTKR